jgi:hypothetical protein
MATTLGLSRRFFRQKRVLEWLLVVLLITVLVGVFVRYIREVQGQGELAAVKTTVGALRTALVIDHLQKQVLAGAGPVVQTLVNPFILLQQQPVNYWGEVTPARISAVPPGSWIYVAQCPCIAYKPADDLWFASPSGDTLVWYAITGMPSVLQLIPKERYHWHNEILD